MNFDSTKQYGTMVIDMASRIENSNSVYNVAKEIYELYNESHYLFSRLSLRELYANYPANQKIVTFVIDEYVITDVVKKAFLTKLYKNDEFEMEFIKRDIGNAYSMLCHIQLVLRVMEITAHPERFKEKQVSQALEMVIKPAIEDTQINAQNFAYAYACLAAKDALNVKEQKQSKTQNSEEQRMDFEVKDIHQCAELYEFLQSSNVIDENTKYNLFLDAITHADMSSIQPKLT